MQRKRGTFITGRPATSWSNGAYSGIPTKHAPAYSHLRAEAPSDVASVPVASRVFSVALFDAAFRGDSELLVEELEWGANPNQALATDSRTALLTAVTKGAPLVGSPEHAMLARDFGNCVTLLVMAGADVNLAAADGTTPLLAAVTGGWVAAAAYLAVQPGVNLRTTDSRGNSAFSLAQDNADLLEVLELAEANAAKLFTLHARGSLPDYPVTEKEKLLAHTVSDRSFPSRRQCLSDLMLADTPAGSCQLPPPWYDHGYSVKLYRAVARTTDLSEKGKDIAAAIEAGADVNQVDLRLLDTPLAVAVYTGCAQAPNSPAQREFGTVITKLLKAGANVGVQDRHGLTPLMHAAVGGWKAAVGCLATHPSCNVAAVDRYGKSALDYARQAQCDDGEDMVKLLELVLAAAPKLDLIRAPWVGGVAGFAAGDATKLQATAVTDKAFKLRVTLLEKLEALVVPPEVHEFAAMLAAVAAAPTKPGAPEEAASAGAGGDGVEYASSDSEDEELLACIGCR